MIGKFYMFIVRREAAMMLPSCDEWNKRKV